MIYAQLHYLDVNYKKQGSLAKEFNSQAEFNSWYRVAKLDLYCVIDVVIGYNPVRFPSLKVVNDARLYSVARNREFEI